jgi:hypothetical protein
MCKRALKQLHKHSGVMIMKTKDPWVRLLRFKVFVLCAVMLLGLFIRPALANNTKISVVKWNTGFVGLFVTGPGGAIWHKAWVAYEEGGGGEWHPTDGTWFSLGNSPMGASFIMVEAVSWGTNRIDVFGSDVNKQVWHKAWNGTNWGSWSDIGGGGINEFQNGIQAVSMASGRIDLFTTRMGTCILYNSCSGHPFKHKWFQNGVWQPSQTGWETLDSSMFGEIFAYSPATNRLQIFSVEGQSSNADPFYRKRWTGAVWSPGLDQWTSFSGGTGNGPPVGVSWSSTRMDSFARGSDGAIWHNSSTNSGINWSGWSTLGGTGEILERSPTAVSWGANRLDVFDTKSVSSLQCEIFHKYWNGSSWGPSKTGPWVSLGIAPFSGQEIEAVSWEPNRLDLFGRANTGEVFHKQWNGSYWDGWFDIGHP